MSGYIGTTHDNDLFSSLGVTTDNYSNYLVGTYGTGKWDITAVSSQAGFHNKFMLDGGTSNDRELFYNKEMNSWNNPETVNLEDTFFSTIHNGLTYAVGSDQDPKSIFTAKVIKEFTFNNVLFGVDDLVIMFNDAGGDTDHDDFILRGKATSATPIPGAVWLLGSGLLGLIGLRRKM